MAAFPPCSVSIACSAKGCSNLFPDGEQPRVPPILRKGRRCGRLRGVAPTLVIVTVLAVLAGMLTSSPADMAVSPSARRSKPAESKAAAKAAKAAKASQRRTAPTPLQEARAEREEAREEREARRIENAKRSGLMIDSKSVIRQEARQQDAARRKIEMRLESEANRKTDQADAMASHTIAQAPVSPDMIMYPKIQPQRRQEDGHTHDTLWRAQSGRCFYCLRPIPPKCSMDHFIPFAERTTQEHEAGDAYNLRLLVACCPDGNRMLSDNSPAERFATVYPGTSLQIGGGMLSPRAQPHDCPVKGRATPPELLLARHRFVRKELLRAATDAEDHARAAILHQVLFGADLFGAEESESESADDPSLSELERFAVRRARVAAVLEAGRAAIRKLAALEGEIGPEKLVARSQEWADEKYDAQLQALEEVLGPAREGTDVENRFKIGWSSELGIHLERYDMRWRLLEQIDFEVPGDGEQTDTPQELEQLERNEEVETLQLRLKRQLQLRSDR